MEPRSLERTKLKLDGIPHLAVGVRCEECGEWIAVTDILGFKNYARGLELLMAASR